MVHKLGAAFLRCSLGPLSYAGGCILSSKVPEGLKELGVDNLDGGFQRGVAEVAREAGVGVADVERLLPMAEVRAQAARLDAAQRAATQAWNAHAGQLGGLLAGVADLTVDGRAPDVSHFLARLAKKVVRDRALSEPLEQLSVEVAGWLDLVERASDIIGDGVELARAYRARRLRLAAAIAAAALALAAIVGVVLFIRAARARVDVVLAAAEADPCVIASVDERDLARASSAQHERAKARRAACDEKKAREEQDRKEKEKLAAAERERARLAKEREDRCAALAEHVAKGALGPEDDALADAQAALLGRVAKGALDKADLAEEALPCAGTSGGAKIADAYAAAVVASPAAWARCDAVSKAAAEALVQKKDALPGSPKQVLAQHADRVALKAIASKDASALARAAALCRLKDDLGVRGGKYCATLRFVAAKR